MAKSNLYREWSKRSPYFLLRYENSVIRPLADYGVGSSSAQENRAKLFGPGFEPYLMAFFIGLYNNKKLPLDRSEAKSLGQPMMYWGNNDRMGRTNYNKLMEYVFIALVARTDVDFIALEKGMIKSRFVVDRLIETMEAYANYGFRFLEEQLNTNANNVYNSDYFLNLILSLAPEDSVLNDDEEEDEPEPLD